MFLSIPLHSGCEPSLSHKNLLLLQPPHSKGEASSKVSILLQSSVDLLKRMINVFQNYARNYRYHACSQSGFSSFSISLFQFHFRNWSLVRIDITVTCEAIQVCTCECTLFRYSCEISHNLTLLQYVHACTGSVCMCMCMCIMLICNT